MARRRGIAGHATFHEGPGVFVARGWTVPRPIETAGFRRVADKALRAELHRRCASYAPPKLAALADSLKASVERMVRVSPPRCDVPVEAERLARRYAAEVREMAATAKGGRRNAAVRALMGQGMDEIAPLLIGGTTISAASARAR